MMRNECKRYVSQKAQANGGMVCGIGYGMWYMVCGVGQSLMPVTGVGSQEAVQKSWATRVLCTFLPCGQAHWATHQAQEQQDRHQMGDGEDGESIPAPKVEYPKDKVVVSLKDTIYGQENRADSGKTNTGQKSCKEGASYHFIVLIVK